ncbi:MAG: response regulator, partial [Algicola sp.]|nr:response regulator [Algicola sp.]
PMNAVIGLGRLALKTRLDAQQKDYIAKVVNAGMALLGLIDDILDFSQLEDGHLTIENSHFQLDALVHRAVNLSVMNAYGKGLELITDIDPKIPMTLQGDPVRLQQIIVNLVNNAVKFTETGSVCIRVGIKQHSKDGLTLQCSVIDTGIGIDPSGQDRLFHSFSQADESMTRKYGGTGLGLSIAKQLTELMGGKIWLQSELAQGATFHFTVDVKIVKQQPLSVFEQLSTDEKQRIAGLKVLVVEDTLLARQAQVTMLTYLGISCDQADSGEQAIELTKVASQANNPYDLVLMDWNMPGMDGIQTSQQIHSNGFDETPHILMVSAYDRDEARTRLHHSQISQFIEKPISAPTLLDAFNQQLFNDGKPATLLEQSNQPQIPDLSDSTILLVEDNMINTMVALGILADTGVKIDTAVNGKLALEQLQKSRYDLILMDIQMPEMDGLTATREIRQTLKMLDIPIIAVTAHASAEDAQKSLDAGMNEHLTKPLDPDKLYSTLDSYLNKNREKATDNLYTVDQSKVTKDTGDLPLAQVSLLNQLAQINGLDSRQALIRIGGRTTLYLGLVKDFYHAQQDLKQTLLDLHKQQDWPVLYRAVHSLKSNAAYIGAFELASLSEAVQTDLGRSQGPSADKTGKNPDTAQFDTNKLFSLCEILDALMNQFHPLYPDQSASIDEMATEAFDIDKFKASLDTLLPLLTSSDFSAEQQLVGISKMSSQSDYANEIAEIIEYVDDIEFEQAVDVARGLIARL